MEPGLPSTGLTSLYWFAGDEPQDDVSHRQHKAAPHRYQVGLWERLCEGVD